ncbi:permease-like cell division protein FtsX [Nocardioides limicola]|uniref:permease-like cell division protein FtsX n=1 Tax=Nocardioides limicola TaxID=2803368 RepID=UPI00193B565D|nr:permease-like cell division protein FtsX [Nocardioides sp. DJM-14]
MPLRYVFTELFQGLRRNLSMHLAVVLTLFVSLTLVGLGVLLNQQAAKAEAYWGSQLQITVFLCRDRDDNPSCNGEVTDAQKEAILDVVETNPEVAGHYLESKEEAFEKVKEIFGEEPFSGPNPAADVDSMPEAIWIELVDPRDFEGITSAVIGLDGVSSIRDLRHALAPIYASINVLKWGALGIAGFLVLAAILLVGNTIRLAAVARRREIGIMRLVGASTLYIALPFLLESLVSAIIGVGLAAGALGAFMYFGVHQRISVFIDFLPWIGVDEYLFAVAGIAILGPMLTMLPTLALIRKYVKV